jgi:hypothetical protein
VIFSLSKLAVLGFHLLQKRAVIISSSEQEQKKCAPQKILKAKSVLAVPPKGPRRQQARELKAKRR